MYDPKKTVMKALKTFLVVVASGVIPALSSPEFQKVIQDSPLIVASVPLLTAMFAAGLNMMKHWNGE